MEMTNLGRRGKFLTRRKDDRGQGRKQHRNYDGVWNLERQYNVYSVICGFLCHLFDSL